MQLEKIQQFVKCSIVPSWGWTEVSENQGHGKGIEVTLPCTSSGSVPGSQRLSVRCRTGAEPPASLGRGWHPAEALHLFASWDWDATGSSRHLPTASGSPGKGERRKLPGQAVEMLIQVQADHCTWRRGKEWGISCNSSSQARGVQHSLECVT